jgi:acetate kinase
MRTLVLNAGSRTLKASLVIDGIAASRAELPASDGEHALEAIVGHLGDDGRVDAVAHRIVHGGEAFTAAVVADQAVLEVLRGLAALAPLHMPPAISMLAAAMAWLPDTPQVGCFDTAFHATLPDSEVEYPLPSTWRTEWGIRRYGFHGLSVEWAVNRAAELLHRPLDDLQLVVAHLGGGCSVTAVDGGRSVRTSMGYTPLEGLMMGTRSGSIDPGILLTVLRQGRSDVDTLTAALEHESGLLGVSGKSGDMREVEAAADRGDARALLALRMFVAHAAAGIAAASTALARIDGVIFTGGIGEHAARVRAAIVGQLGVLGIASITADEVGIDQVLSSGGPAIIRIEAREDLVCARQAMALIGGQ